MKSRYYFLALIFALSLSLFTPHISSSQSEEPFFTITLLTPYIPPTSASALYFIFPEDAAKIGIEIKVSEEGWPSIYSRAFNYNPTSEHPYIPSYEEGGYDLLVVSWMVSIYEWKDYELFLSTNMPPNGWNFYQLDSDEYDQLADNYAKEFDVNQRITYFKQIQQLLYHQLPSLTYVYMNYYAIVRNSLELDSFAVFFPQGDINKWRDPYDDTIFIATDGSDYSSDFNIAFGSDGTFKRFVADAIYGRLFRRDVKTFAIKPEIALNYNFSTNYENLTINLNPAAKFSDGTLVTAEDVKFSLDMHFSNESSPFYNEFNKVFGDPNSIIVVDNDTLLIHMVEPTPFVFDLLSVPIFNKALLEPILTNIGFDVFKLYPFDPQINGSTILSCGPYVLSDYEITSNNNTDNITLVPNPYWSIDTAPEDNIFVDVNIIDVNELIELYNSGVADILIPIYRSRSDFSTLTDYSIFLSPCWGYGEFAVNLKHPILGTGELTPKGTADAAQYVRKALNHAINRERILTEAFRGNGKEGIIPISPDTLGFDETLIPYEYNLTLAESYLEKAGYSKTSEETTNATTSTSTASTITTKEAKSIFFILIASLVGITWCLLKAKRKEL